MSIASSSEDTHLKAVIGSTPYARSVPFENNIGGRNIAPTALLDRIDWGQVLDTLRKRRFRVVNPFDKAKAQALRPRRTFDVLSTLVPPIFPAIREARRLLFLQPSPAEGRWLKRSLIMLPQKMRAAVVHQFNKPLEIEDVPVPRPGLDQILVRVVSSGVCHTDLHAACGDWPVKPSLPFIPGHEGVGYVAAAGAGVTVVKEGDRVGVPWLHTACGRCSYCLTGWETLCGAQKNTGYSVNGGYADYVLADPLYVGRIPAGLDFTAAAPILCAGVTTYKGIKETDTKPGDWVVIVGAGGLGHLGIQYARAMGLHVAAVDVADDKLELARELGAELLVNAKKEDPAAAIQSAIDGAHGVLVTAVSTESFAQSIGMLRRGGTCALVGLPPGNFSTPIFDVVLKRLTIRGSIVGTRMDLEECLAFAAEGKVKAATKMASLEQINAVFDRMRLGDIHGRIVLQMT